MLCPQVVEGEQAPVDFAAVGEASKVERGEYVMLARLVLGHAFNLSSSHISRLERFGREDPVRVVPLVGLLTLTSLAAAQDRPRPTYDAVVAGMKCTQSVVAAAQIDCEYRVGRSLHFVIAGVGQDDAAITVLRVSGYDGDYFASFGMLHQCVIVKPGAITLKTSFRARIVPDMAFVSPQTGKVYPSWEECGSAAAPDR